MMEIWKDILGHENFQVSNTGKVRKKAYRYIDSIGKSYFIPESELAVSINKKGYARVELCYTGVKKALTLHRAVMLAFKGSPPVGMDQINHIDGNKINNHPDNLEWSNNSHNIKHAWRTGLFKPKLPSSLESPHAIIVVHKEYGTFNTVLEAAKECGIQRTKLSKMVKNILPNTTKYLRA